MLQPQIIHPHVHPQQTVAQQQLHNPFQTSHKTLSKQASLAPPGKVNARVLGKPMHSSTIPKSAPNSHAVSPAILLCARAHNYDRSTSCASKLQVE